MNSKGKSILCILFNVGHGLWSDADTLSSVLETTIIYTKLFLASSTNNKVIFTLFNESEDSLTLQQLEEIEDAAKEIMKKPAFCQPDQSLPRALSQALCKLNKERAEGASEMKIFLVSPSVAVAARHVPLMNCIFAAQKLEIVVDVVDFSGADANKSSIQQLSSHTKGIYVDVDGEQDYSLILSTFFGVAKKVRRIVNTPTQLQIDHRPMCFCHQKSIDVGYVCAVCLSSMCEA